MVEDLPVCESSLSSLLVWHGGLSQRFFADRLPQRRASSRTAERIHLQCCGASRPTRLREPRISIVPADGVVSD